MIIRYFGFVLFLFTATFATAQESMMTDVSYEYLDKLIIAAKTNYPKMKAYDHKIKLADLNVARAKLDWLNILSFIYLYNPYGQPGQTGTVSALSGFQAGFSLSIGTILQKPGLVKTAREELDIAELDQQEYTLNIQAIVQQRYFTYIQQRTMLGWRTKDLQNIEATLKDIKYKFEKGEKTFEDYNNAMTAYSQGVQGKIQAEGAYLLAKSNLEEIVGAKLETIQ